MKLAITAFVAAAGCTVVNLPEAHAPGVATAVVATAISRTVWLKDSGCTGILVGGNRLVTAKHCAPDDAKAGDAYEGGTLLHISPAYDFVVVQVRDPRTRIELRGPTTGEHLYVVGYPVQLGSGDQELTVTDGIVAGPSNEDGEARITAPVYFGNSGGGVWADDGSLLGVAVSIYAFSPGFVRPIPYVAQSFMVPASVVLPWL